MINVRVGDIVEWVAANGIVRARVEQSPDGIRCLLPNGKWFSLSDVIEARSFRNLTL